MEEQVRFSFRDFHILRTTTVFIFSSTSTSKQPMARNKTGNCQILYYKSIPISGISEMIFKCASLCWGGEHLFCLFFGLGLTSGQNETKIKKYNWVRSTAWQKNMVLWAQTPIWLDLAENQWLNHQCSVSFSFFK